MSAALTDHVPHKDIYAQAEDAHKAWAIACVRVIETMVFEMVEIFSQHPEVQVVSFDQDGDADNVPTFECLDENGEDLSEELEYVDKLAERWNETTSDPVVDFLVRAENVMLHRESLVKDVHGLCKKLAKSLPLSEKDAKSWLASFSAHVEATHLSAATPKSRSPRPPSRI